MEIANILILSQPRRLFCLSGDGTRVVASAFIRHSKDKPAQLDGILRCHGTLLRHWRKHGDIHTLAVLPSKNLGDLHCYLEKSPTTRETFLKDLRICCLIIYLRNPGYNRMIRCVNGYLAITENLLILFDS